MCTSYKLADMNVGWNPTRWYFFFVVVAYDSYAEPVAHIESSSEDDEGRENIPPAASETM